jgi:hypothetical protein
MSAVESSRSLVSLIDPCVYPLEAMPSGQGYYTLDQFRRRKTAPVDWMNPDLDELPEISVQIIPVKGALVKQDVSV